LERIRVAVIGVGHLGEYHVQKYKSISGVDLVGVVDIDRERAWEIAHRYGTKPYFNHRDVLDKVDAVSCVVPTESHFEVAKDILSCGIHMLIEKPITYHIEPADTLIKIAKDRGLILQVGLVERFNPAIVSLRKFLHAPIFMEAHRMNRFTKRGIDVDVVLDLMIHDLDIFLHLIPYEVKELHSTGLSVITDKTDIANVRMIFENGTVANLTASRVSTKILRKIRVFQKDMYLSANCYKRELDIITLDSQRRDADGYPTLSAQKLSFPDSDPLMEEIRSFVDAVRTGNKPQVSGEDGRRALKYALIIMDQIREGCKEFKDIRSC